jgi:predicted transcriptional regulator
MHDVERYSRVTGAGLDRKTGSLDGKILFIEQIGGDEPGQLKFLMTEGELTLLYAERDERGRIVSKTHRIEGVPVVISTLAGAVIDTQLLNRVSAPEMDESETQTGLIIKDKLESWSTVQREPPESILEQLQYIDAKCRKLGKQVIDVKIPFALQLEEKLPKVLAMRRGLDRIASLVAAVAFVKAALGLRPVIQLSKPDNPNLFVIAMPEDLQDALFCLGSALAESITFFFGKAKKIYDYLCGSVLANNTTREVARQIGLSQNRAREYLNMLVDLGYATKTKEKQTYQYEAIAKDRNLTLNLAALFSDEELRHWYETQFDQGQAKLLLPPVVIVGSSSEPKHSTVLGFVAKTPTIQQTAAKASLDENNNVATVDLKRQDAHEDENVGDASEAFPAIALGALRVIKAPFTEDYAVGRIMRTMHVTLEEAEAWVKRMIDEGLLAKDPEDYLRLVK